MADIVSSSWLMRFIVYMARVTAVLIAHQDLGALGTKRSTSLLAVYNL